MAIVGTNNRHTIEKTSQQLNKFHLMMLELKYLGKTYEEIHQAIRATNQTNKYTVYSIQKMFSINGDLYEVYNQFVREQTLNRMKVAKTLFEAEVELAAGYIIKKLKEAIAKDQVPLALELSREVLNRVRIFDAKQKGKEEEEENNDVDNMSVE